MQSRSANALACPECSARYKRLVAFDDLGGERVRCPWCLALLTEPGKGRVDGQPITTRHDA